MPEEHATGQAEPLRSRFGLLSALVLLVVGLAVTAALLLDDDDGGAVEQALAGPMAGMPAAPFEVDLIGGGRFSLQEHLEIDGRPIVLNLWASWCGPCRAEMPAFDAVSRAKPEVLIIGVAVEDEPAAARAFADEIGVSYPLAIDEEGLVAELYPFFGLPTTYLIDGGGVIVRQIQGSITEAQLRAFLESEFGI